VQTAIVLNARDVQSRNETSLLPVSGTGHELKRVMLMSVICLFYLIKRTKIQ